MTKIDKEIVKFLTNTILSNKQSPKANSAIQTKADKKGNTQSKRIKCSRLQLNGYANHTI